MISNIFQSMDIFIFLNFLTKNKNQALADQRNAHNAEREQYSVLSRSEVFWILKITFSAFTLCSKLRLCQVWDARTARSLRAVDDQKGFVGTAENGSLKRSLVLSRWREALSDLRSPGLASCAPSFRADSAQFSSILPSQARRFDLN